MCENLDLFFSIVKKIITEDDSNWSSGRNDQEERIFSLMHKEDKRAIKRLFDNFEMYIEWDKNE